MSRFCQAICWTEVVQDFTPCALEPFTKLKARSRHLTTSRLISCSQIPLPPNPKSKTLLISPTPDNYRTTIRLARSLPLTTVGLLATGGAAIFSGDALLTLAPENSLTAYAVASSPRALLLASIWWPVGFALATAYFVFIS